MLKAILSMKLMRRTERPGMLGELKVGGLGP